MAYYYGINKGENEYAASTSTTVSTGKEIEVTVNNTAVTDRASVIVALEQLINVILRNNYPL